MSYGESVHGQQQHRHSLDRAKSSDSSLFSASLKSQQTYQVRSFSGLVGLVELMNGKIDTYSKAIVVGCEKPEVDEF